jgi:hypothetical protein
MPIQIPKNKSLSVLTEDDNVRLRKLAPLFDMQFCANGKNFFLSIGNGTERIDVGLPLAVAHLRLLAEICAKAAPWVHFHLAQSCRDSLLHLSDARIERVAQLYARERDAKQMLAEDTCVDMARPMLP